MNIQLVRHATLRVSLAGSTLLVDPILSPPGTNPPVVNTANEKRNPLVPLPISAAEVLRGVDAVLVTHTHRDHWDDAATEAIPKHLPILCQPEDEAKFRDWKFTDVRPIAVSLAWKATVITRTGGRHGTGDIGQRMAPVSGFVLRTPGEPTLYIAGDTIWCDEVRRHASPARARCNRGERGRSALSRRRSDHDERFRRDSNSPSDSEFDRRCGSYGGD